MEQEVVKLAKEADPEMMRTLGVLTKPDRIGSGEESQWRAILEGTRYPLKLGWFMVKNPNQKELDDQISFETARLKEEAFFDNNPALKVPNHVGTHQLRQTLSKQLVELIKRILPDMMQQLQEYLDQAEAELKTLPWRLRWWSFRTLQAACGTSSEQLSTQPKLARQRTKPFTGRSSPSLLSSSAASCKLSPS